MSTEELLCDENNPIYTAVHNAICKLSAGEEPAWDMEMIADATDAIIDVMRERNIPVCYPWMDEDKQLCCTLPDGRCSHCTRKDPRCVQ